MHQMKGVYELLEAFRIVRNSLSKASLVFVGDGPAGTELHERVQAAGLPDAVRLVGSVSDAEVVEHLIDSDIVVIPSRSDSIPLVLTEAVQANRPVIGTDIGDLGTTISEYGLGAVTQSLDPMVLAATMAELAQAPAIDPDGRRRLLDRMQPAEAVRTFLSLASDKGMQSKITGNSATTPKKPAYSE
ncbi:MAG: glycosyltransferase [candidate division Zixibacteria bacterium]|nr:glycosyltransferase [candidate division Zixibacteria bacterium]